MPGSHLISVSSIEPRNLNPEIRIVGNSLQDQLLKAGLIDEQRLKESRSSKRKVVKQTGKRRPEVGDEARRAAERARAEKAERDRDLNRRQQEEAARRARENEIRQLIHSNRVVREGGDVAFNFTDGTTLKRLYVNRDQQAALIAGRLAIVRQDTFYELVPAETAERVRARDPSLVLLQNRESEHNNESDPYAQFQVPDDLMW